MNEFIKSTTCDSESAQGSLIWHLTKIMAVVGLEIYGVCYNYYKSYYSKSQK